MTITEERAGNIIILSLDGRLDTQTAAQVEQQLLAAVDEKPTGLVLDCTQLSYVSSVGLRVIVLVSKRLATAQGRLALCGLSESMLRVFNLVGLGNWGNIHPSREAAIASLT